MTKDYRKYNKYNAKRTMVDGTTFASKLEARRYNELVLLQKAREIRYFLRQIPFYLPGQKYICDFMVVHNDSTIVYEDCKGMVLPLFKAKKALVETLYPIEIKILTSEDIRK